MHCIVSFSLTFRVIQSLCDILLLLIAAQGRRDWGRAGQIGSGVTIADDDRDTCEDDSL